MAITPFGSFTVDWTTKATKISGQASNFKTWLNTRTEDIKTYINGTLIAALQATTDGASGADQIGMTAISGWAGATPQAIMESAKADVDLKETIANVNEVKRRMLMGVSYFG